MTDLFNNREISVIVWTIILLVGLILNKKIRDSFFDKDLKTTLFLPIKIFFNPKIIIPVLLFISYISLIVFFVQEIGLWELYLLKETILWIFFAGIISLFRFGSSRKSISLFRETILDNIKIVIIFEFIINAYTFSLVGEMFLVPIVSIIAFIDGFSESDDELRVIKKITSLILVVAGWGVLFFTLYQAISDFRNFGSLENLKSFILPIFLTFCSLPYLYFYCLLIDYEQLFMRVEIGFENSSKFKRKIKRSIFWHCNLNLQKTNKALNMGLFNLMGIKNESDLEEMKRIYKEKL